MLRTLYLFILGCLSFSSASHAAQEILLRLQPAPEAPVIAKVIASDRVILDTAPAPMNAELGWRKISLPTPFEGYVPVVVLDKNFTIVEGTSVYYLPTAESGIITRIEDGDIYEVVRVKEEWATFRFQKSITGYFVDDSTEEVVINFDSLKVPLVSTKPAAAPAPAPIAIPALPIQINPDEPIAQLDPDALPEENVVWKPARDHGSDPSSLRSAVTGSEGESITSTSHPQRSPIAQRATEDASRITDLMVSPDQTQAREAAPDLGPAKAPRLLTGLLVREISVEGPAYPIRLKSPEGRLIAYVDFSGIYLNDLSTYIDQKVYIRGQIYPLPDTPAQLVILAESLRLAK